MKTEQDGDADESHRQRRRMLPDGEPGDDVCGVTGLGRACNFLHGPIAHRSVIVSDHHHDRGHDQPDHRSEVKLSRCSQQSTDCESVWK